VDGPPRPALQVRFAPDGRHLLTLGEDDSLRVWEAGSGRPVRTLAEPKKPKSRLAVSPRGTRCAFGEEGGVRVWDWTTDQPGPVLEGPPDGVSTLTFSPDGRRLASGGWKDNSVRVGDADTGATVRTIPAGGPVERIAFQRDGEGIVTFCPNLRQLRRWQGDHEMSSNTLPGEGRLWPSAIAADGRYVATIDGKTTLTVWRPDAGRWRDISYCGERAGTASDSSAFSPDHRLIAVGGNQGSITVWELASGRQVLRFTDHTRGVFDLSFSPDGRSLASVSRDGTGLVWDMTMRSQGTVAPGRPGTGAELDRLWNDLASEDAAAYRAVCTLANSADPVVTLAFLRDRLRADPGPRADDLIGWIADLDSPRYAVREKATSRLAEHAAEAEAVLRRRLAEPIPLEVRRRIDRLLAALPGQPVSPATIRRLRAVMALERIGPPARDALAGLAADPRAPFLAEEARASLERLDRP
jgi:WD40 repeat protein